MLDITTSVKKYARGEEMAWARTNENVEGLREKVKKKVKIRRSKPDIIHVLHFSM